MIRFSAFNELMAQSIKDNQVKAIYHMVKVRNKKITENTNTKANGILVKNRGKVTRKTHLRNKNTLDYFMKIKDKELVNQKEKTDIYLKALGKLTCQMDQASKSLETETNTRELLKMG